MRAPQRVTQRRCESLPINFSPRRRRAFLSRGFPEETRETSSESGSRRALFISHRRDTLRPWSTTLATAETSFVARARARASERRGKGGEGEPRVSVMRCCVAYVCVCVCLCEHTGGQNRSGRSGETERREARSTRCPIWYPATAVSAILLAHAHAYTRTRLPTLPTISDHCCH